MIRPWFLFALFVAAVSIAVSAQTGQSTSTPPVSSLACPAESDPPPDQVHNVSILSSGVVGGHRIAGKNPKYPKAAKKAHVEGDVVLRATISTSGNIEHLCVVQGPSMLQQPSLDAVSKWRYEPFVLKGEPVEVETQITVDFALH